MSSTSCLVNRYDHLEFATRDAAKLESLFSVLGFTTTQWREGPVGLQKLMVQGQMRFLLTQGAPGTFAREYVEKHGEGVCSIAFHSVSAQATLKTALARGAEIAQEPRTEEDRTKGFKVTTAAIRSFGDVRATFVERTLPAFDVHAPFAPGFQSLGKGEKETQGLGLLSLDHLTNNVEMNQLEKWSNFYKQTYGWVEARYFDIRGAQTGLHSKVMQSPDGATKIPINEATEKKSQIQEFIDEHHGAGVQHIALLTHDICKVVSELRGRGISFLRVLPKYYHELPQHLQKNLKEPLEEVANLGLLVDGDEKGYLLQIFSENQIGPLFFEIIQRRNHNGFGEGNFKALFEAMEADQMRRGKLTA